MAPRTPLLRPDSYFAERPTGIGRALAVVAVVTAALLAGAYGVGWVLTDRVDGTVTVDNPERPSETFCEKDALDHPGCDQPAEVERNIDSIIWDALPRSAGQFVWAVPLAWLLVGLLLHAGSWLAGGEGGASRSFAVAAWGLAPSVFSIVVGLVVLAVTFDPVTVTPADDPAAFGDLLMAELQTLRTAGTALGAVTLAWGAVIWKYGLEHERGLPGPAAAGVAAIVAFIAFLFSLG